MKKNGKHEAQVIDITEHIKKRKLQNAIKQEQLNETESDLSELIELMELGTDDIAGTLVARHIYNVDLLPGISTQDLMKELKIRVVHHTTLLEDLEDKIND
tara:strand:- start:180 stop:482 length:303 start_codon:yes stop_codon:yes gene_type:complete